MGKKYLLEIEENKDGGFAWSNFAPYTEPDLEQVRKEAYKEGREAGIKDGMCEAWEAARTLWNTPTRKEIFGYTTFSTTLTTLTAQEVIEKIRAYEQAQKEIQVGDEVFYGNTKGIVIRPEDSDRYASVFTAIGEHITAENKDLTKTGRHFPEIAAVLEKMQMKDGDNE